MWRRGRNVLREAGTHISKVGEKPLVLWDPRVKSVVGERVLASLKAAALETVDVEFRGDSTEAEAARVAQIARDQRADVIVGLGGGKTLDTAKAAAAAAGTKMVTDRNFLFHGGCKRSCPDVLTQKQPSPNPAPRMKILPLGGLRARPKKESCPAIPREE